MLATVTLSRPHVGVEPEPKGRDVEDSTQITEEGTEHAKKRDVD